jgi:hypothetical protein
MDMVGETIEQRASETLALENARPFLQWKIRRDNGRAALVALADDLEEELGASLGEWHVAEFVDDRELEVSKLFTAGKRAARMRRSTMRRSRSMSSSSARRRRKRT